MTADTDTASQPAGRVPLRLNLGCGFDHREGYENIDFSRKNGADEAIDLTKLPWKWADDSVNEILCLNLLEHVQPLDGVWHEIHRILKPGGIVDIEVEYGKSHDPFHGGSYWKRRSIRSLTNGYATDATPKFAFERVGRARIRHPPSGFPYWHFWHYTGRNLPPLPFTVRLMRFKLRKL